VINFAEKLTKFTAQWSPKIVAQMNDYHFKVVKLQGDFVWHSHADTDETFIVLEGELGIDFKDGPVAFLLTRQNLPVLDQNKYGSAKNASKGAYVLLEEKKPDAIIMATGSEVSLALIAAEALAKDGVKTQVVSIPSWELFEKQQQSYKDSVLPPKVKARVAVEAGIELGWHKYIGEKGKFIGMSSFGASAPAKVCFEKFGITTENIIKSVKDQL